MSVIVFGYASLLNLESLLKTCPGATVLESVVLKGYQRKANAVCDCFPDVALNLVLNPDLDVEGNLIEIPDSDMSSLLEREAGYEMIDVTENIFPKSQQTVVTFIAPNVNDYGGKKIYQAYLDICLSAISEDKRDQWLKETIIDCGVSTDCRKEAYAKHS